MFSYLKAGVKIVNPYGKLPHFEKLIVQQFLVIEHQSLQSVNSTVYVFQKPVNKKTNKQKRLIVTLRIS